MGCRIKKILQYCINFYFLKQYIVYKNFSATAPFSLEIQLTKKVFIPKDQGTKTYNFRGTTLIMYKTYTSLKVKISSKIASIWQIRSFHQPLPLLIFKSYLLILFIAFCYLFMTKLYFIYSFLSINSSFWINLIHLLIILTNISK